MNEKKWINKHRITIVQYISANSQDGKMHWIMIIKNNNGHNFQFTKFLFIDFVLTHRRSLLGKQPKLASGKSSSSWFLFSGARNVITKLLNM